MRPNAYRPRILTTRRHPTISLSCTHINTYTTTQAEDRKPIVHIPSGSCIYAFGAPSHTKTPLLRDFGWTVNNGEAWAVVSGGGGRGKNVVFDVEFFTLFLNRKRVSC